MLRSGAAIALALAAAIASAVVVGASAQQTLSREEIDRLERAAFDATRQSCSSPEARSIYQRLEDAGESNNILLAFTYDPLRCEEPGTDAAKAAELYRREADTPASYSRTTAIRNLVALIEAGHVSAAPQPNAAAVLGHYGAALKARDLRDGADLLAEAYLKGDEASLAVLRDWALADPQRPIGGFDTRDDAACKLGEALMKKFPDGSRDQGAIEAFGRCSNRFPLGELRARRVDQNRATTADMIWLLEQNKADFVAQDVESAFPRILDTARAPGASADLRQAAALHLYRNADRHDYDTAADWLAVRKFLSDAYALDPLPGRDAGLADQLYLAALKAPNRFYSSTEPVPAELVQDAEPSLDEDRDELAAERAAAFVEAAALYDASRAPLETEQLARLAVLSLRGFGAAGAPQRAPRALEELARRGDGAAANTLAALDGLNDELRLEPASVSEIVAGESICARGNLVDAIDRSASMYARLSAMRAVPKVPVEVVHGVVTRARTEATLFSVLPPDTAILLYSRDYLRQCVWLLDGTGIAGFEAVYAGNSFAGQTLQGLLSADGVSAGQRGRAPAVRESDPPTRGIEIEVEARGDSPAAMRAASALLLPGEIQRKVRGYKHLVIVPQGRIGAFPFAALPLEDGTVLLDHASVAVAPSVVDLFASAIGNQLAEGSYMRQPPGCPKGTVLQRSDNRSPVTRAVIVGDPDYSSEREFVLPSLSGARAEAVDVAASLRVPALLGAAATRQAVAAQASSADVLYFATHGVSFGKTGLDGFIALSDGRWTAREVQNTCLAQTRLVVLSACQTGLGQAVDGGIIGLARGFQIAGAPDVVMSLWNVNDEATRKLMTRFMRSYNGGEAPASALRAAMLETRREYPNPRDWSGFTVLSESLR